MPKIQQIKGHDDTSFFIQSIQKRDFNQYKNKSGSRTAARSIHDSIVPIHQVSYNPQYSKSPLANVQIQKKAHIQPIDSYPQESIYYDFKSRIENIPPEVTQKTTCKTILFRVLIVLLVLGIIAGLYFLLDAILSHKFTQQSQQQPPTPSNQNIKVYPSIAVQPIYFDPISYDSMSTYSAPAKSSSIPIYKDSIPPLTFPSALPSNQYSNSMMIKNDKNEKQKINDSTTIKNINGQIYQQSLRQQSYDYSENSIAPLNVYEK